MSRLDDALAWYGARLAALTAIHTWIREGRPDAPQVAPFLAGYVRLSKGDALKELAHEREDLQRMALIRLFSAFEADFRVALAAHLKRACDALSPGGTSPRNAGIIEAALPDSVELSLALYRALEPSFSGSDKGHLDKLRGFRNDLLHGGFDDLIVKDDPRDAHALGRRCRAGSCSSPRAPPTRSPARSAARRRAERLDGRPPARRARPRRSPGTAHTSPMPRCARRSKPSRAA